MEKANDIDYDFIDALEYGMPPAGGIGYDSNKAILDEGDMALKSQHAGLHDDEIYIPLIVFTK